MLRGKRILIAGLPLWPQIYVSRRGVVTVTGRHATIARHRLMRAFLNLLLFSGLTAMAVLGFCLAGRTSSIYNPTFNRVQRYRLITDHFLINHGGDPLRRLPWPVFENELYAGQRLNSLVWLGLGVAWLLLIVLLRALNRSLFSGWLFAGRTTVQFTRDCIVFYRYWFRPWRFWRDSVDTIQFRAEPHPQQQLSQDGNLAADVRNLYHDSGRLVMVYGMSIVPIGIIVGAEATGQFSDCCVVAAGLSRQLPAGGQPPKDGKPTHTPLE